jgi:hypothetical protein
MGVTDDRYLLTATAPHPLTGIFCFDSASYDHGSAHDVEWPEELGTKGYYDKHVEGSAIHPKDTFTIPSTLAKQYCKNLFGDGVVVDDQDIMHILHHRLVAALQFFCPFDADTTPLVELRCHYIGIFVVRHDWKFVVNPRPDWLLLDSVAMHSQGLQPGHLFSVR